MFRLLLSVMALIVLGAMPVAGQESALQAEILRGTCEEPDEIIADLTAPPVSVGDPAGAPDARTAANSFSVAPVALTSLLSEPTAIAVSVNGARIACSGVGGVANAAGDLALGLLPSDGTDAFGIVYLSPSDADPTQTDVSLFVVPPTGEDSAQENSAEGGETPSGEISVGDLSSEGNVSDELLEEIGTGTQAETNEALGAGDDGTGDAEAASEPTQTPAPLTPTPVPELGTLENPVPIGTPLTGSGLEVTPLSAYYSYGYGFSTPKGGFTYLVIEVQIRNISDRSESYGFTSFSGEDLDSGAGYDSIWVLADGLLDSGSLDPGEYVSGTIVLEVQETAARVLVKYDPAMFDPNDLYWLVG